VKSRIILLTIFSFALAVFARSIVPYDSAKPPSLPLPKAYDCAMTALGAETNQFHCISTKVSTDFGPEGGWQFTFYSTNSKPKWVTVEFNGKTHVENIMFR
jgi:hypothetical protein